ncbi:multiple antibiotic resistance protein [Loktanella sp. DSM 29012]|uniref:MarC family protein n=1 Tax=Loktanella sp. DSM 29012 TaxID=1881056 RepID=UPI0008B60B35|nr:MarC family protein [Loktanella sp. DSM 29012]SEP71083.1 multiple antibiotic resistance protein [Loktanella sp. DSM 29012]
MDLTALSREFVTLFVLVDPIGSIPVFLFAVSAVPRKLHRRFALRATLIAGLVLFGFLVLGQLALEAIGLDLGSFQIAGGIVLFLFALTMIFGDTKSDTEIEEAEKHRDHLAGAVFPLAMPSIASPGAMLGIVVLTDNRTQTLPEQAVTAGLLLLVLIVTLICMFAATYIFRLIGHTGISVISRVMGIILATIAVDAVLVGLESLGLFEISPAAIPAP